MKLIGQYDSPFVRRVAVALRLYGLVYEHLPWSTFGDAERIAAYNPLIRVPTLVLDDGFVLTDSAAILLVLDDLMGDRASLARTGPDRREALRLTALAAGAADKGVSLLYERAFRETELPMWIARCRGQVEGALADLETARAARPGDWLFGDAISHADVMLGAALTFLTEALPGVFALQPALAAHRERCEALPEFQAAYQSYRLVRPAA